MSVDGPSFLVERRRLVAAVLVVLVAVVGAGAADLGQSSSLDQFETESVPAEKLDVVESTFATGAENRTTVQVVVRGEEVLSKASLLDSLALQRTIRENATVNATLAPERPTAGVANLVAMAAMAGEGGAGPTTGGGPPPADSSEPPLDAQIRALETTPAEEVRRLVSTVLAPGDGTGSQPGPLALVPTDYEPGSGTAEARMLVVVQTTEADVGGISDASDRLVTSQRAIQAIVADHHGEDAFVFGLGIVSDEIGRSMGDSFTIITPLMLLFVLVTLGIAYRDLLDVVLGLVGVVLVMVWMAGFMGWAGIAFNQMLIAVPMLLIGLSLDYAIHVVMRYREARADGDRAVDDAMVHALGGVGVALLWVTATTGFGFLANLSSPVPPIREFGLVSAAGILGTLVVFGGLLPALKVELDAGLERLGLDREKRAFGTGGGVLTRVLALGTDAARRAPVAVLVVALVLSAGGAYGATQVDTSFDQSDFLAEDPPAWMDALPGPLAPGDYTVRRNVAYVDAHFLQLRETTRAQILVEGPVTGPETLSRLAEARAALAGSETTVSLAGGESSVDGPLSVLERLAATNATVADAVSAADTDDDGVPDRDLATVYDAAFAAAPDRMSQYVHRGPDGEYDALRAVVRVRGDVDVETAAADVRAAAALLDGDGLTATATGQPVVTAAVQAALLETLVTTLALTLGAVLLFLVVAYRIRSGAASLGVVTVLPVLFALSWTLGLMALAGIPFNAETAMITSLAIGLGVDYSIHMGERFTLELERADALATALEDAVTGTGGALLGSAATTAGGFGVLAFALVPSLQRFGVVTAATIVFAFLSTVLVLPSLLVLWVRYGPDEVDPASG